MDAVVEEKCTALHGVPTHFLGVLAEVKKRQESGEILDFSRLRYVIYSLEAEDDQIQFRLNCRCRTGIAAGSSTPIELMKQLIEKLNLRDLTNAYGMSEFFCTHFARFGKDY